MTVTLLADDVVSDDLVLDHTPGEKNIPNFKHVERLEKPISNLEKL